MAPIIYKIILKTACFSLIYSNYTQRLSQQLIKVNGSSNFYKRVIGLYLTQGALIKIIFQKNLI